MVLDVLGLVLGLALGQPSLLDGLMAPEIAFLPRERSVSNWRRQAAMTLDASPGTRAALLLGRDPAAVPRCVRLNNYWCIKRGGWSGEIAADADGHVAFVSSSEGATVAALLLRRYYVDAGRHSALAIVSHWAPASCAAALPVPRRGHASPQGPTPRGIGRTLRARWLASHGHRVARMVRGRSRVSAVPDRLIGAPLPAPTIALGLDPAPIRLSATLPEAVARGSGVAAAPAPACTGDVARINNYAARASAGIAGSITADLALFDAAGMPTPNLARLMRNMASVEIGPLGAGESLVETAVTHAVAIIAARRVGVVGPRPAPENRVPPPSRPGTVLPGRIDEARRPEPRP